jgi:hypothetical protein
MMMNWANEISANIFEESSFAAVFQAGQRTCLVGFTFCLLNKVTESNDKQTIAGSCFGG